MRRRFAPRAALWLALAGVLFGWPVLCPAFDQPWDSGHNTTGYPGGPGSGPGGPGGGGGDPVNLANGNFSWADTDLSIPALGVPLVITRYYNSVERYVGPFGHGWHFVPFKQVIEAMQQDRIIVIVRLGTGQRLGFNDNGDGTFTPEREGWPHTLVRQAGGFALDSGDGFTHLFDGDGRLTATRDRSGNQLTFAYDAQDRLATITDAGGRAVAFEYNAESRVARLVDFTGRTVGYTYDRAGNLVTVTDPAGRTVSYQYDQTHRLMGVVDSAGMDRIQNTYDSFNRVTAQSFGSGSVGFTYNDGETVINSRRGIDFTVGYNAQGLPTVIDLPLSADVTLAYDERYHLTAFSAAGAATGFTYDGADNLVAMTSPGGLTTDYAYADGQVTQVTDAKDRVTQFTYDAAGRLIRTDDPAGGATQFTYDAAGRLTRVTRPDGGQTRFGRNLHGHLTSIVDETAGGALFTATLSYDARGNLTQITRPDGSTLKMTYDVLDRLTQATDSAYVPPRVHSYGYDARGNLSRITENGMDKLFSRPLPRANRITFPDGSTTTYTYNGNDRVTQAEYVRGALVQTHAYTYSDEDRVTQVTLPDGTQYTLTYSGDAVTQVAGPDGIAVTLAWDGENRLAGLAEAASGRDLTFTYDDTHNRTSLTYAPGHQVAYTYDALDRLEQAVTTQGGGDTTLPFSPAVERGATGGLNYLVTAYNTNQANRLTNLVGAAATGRIFAAAPFDLPDVRHWTKTIPANARWSAVADDEIRDKRMAVRLRAPFELFR